MGIKFTRPVTEETKVSRSETPKPSITPKSSPSMVEASGEVIKVKKDKAVPLDISAKHQTPDVSEKKASPSKTASGKNLISKDKLSDYILMGHGAVDFVLHGYAIEKEEADLLAVGLHDFMVEWDIEVNKKMVSLIALITTALVVEGQALMRVKQVAQQKRANIKAVKTALSESKNPIATGQPLQVEDNTKVENVSTPPPPIILNQGFTVAEGKPMKGGE